MLPASRKDDKKKAKPEEVEENETKEETEYTIKEFTLGLLKNIPYVNKWFVVKEVNEKGSKLPDNKEPEEQEEELVPTIVGFNISRGIDNGLGFLRFVLKYESPRGVLKIILQKAEELVGKDPRGTSDPYAVLSFVPPFKNNEYKTMVKMKTLSPIWNHLFVFLEVSETDLIKHRIKIVVYDWDKWGTHESLGEVYYDLKKLHKSESPSNSKSEWLESSKSTGVQNVSPNSKNSVSSNVDDILQLPKIDTSKRIDNWLQENINPDVLNIEEEKRSVIYPDNMTESDYREIERSASMRIGMDTDSEEEEEEEVYDNIEMNKFGIHDEIERSKKEVQKQWDVEEKTHLYSTKSNIEEKEVDKGVDHNEDSKSQRVIRRIEVTKYLSPLPNSRSKFGELYISLNYNIRIRKLVVTIIKAQGMIDPTRRSLVPYCSLRHLHITKAREKTKSLHRTSYRYYTSDPVWNEDFYLKVPPDKLKSTAVEIQVFHSTKATQISDELLGIIRLGLKAYQKQRTHWTEFLGSIGVPVAKWHDIRL